MIMSTVLCKVLHFVCKNLPLYHIHYMHITMHMEVQTYIKGAVKIFRLKKIFSCLVHSILAFQSSWQLYCRLSGPALHSNPFLLLFAAQQLSVQNPHSDRTSQCYSVAAIRLEHRNKGKLLLYLFIRLLS